MPRNAHRITFSDSPVNTANGLGRTKWGSIICCNPAIGICSMPDAEWHGTSGGYSNHRCKCRKCKDAWNSLVSDRRAVKKASVYE